MATSVRVRDFLPSRHGFHFRNRFDSQPTIQVAFGPLKVDIGDAKNGLCGGFCLGTRDRFQRGEAPPPDLSAPNRGNPLFEELVRRQVDSFERGRIPLRFLRLANYSTDAKRAAETLNEAWPRIKGDLDGGRLSMVGLVRATGRGLALLGVHHQVLAYGYDLDGDVVRIHVYEPNYENNDTVQLVVRLIRPGPGQAPSGVELSQSTGENLVALIRAN